MTSPFKPKKGGYIYDIACDQSVVGCHTLAQGIQAGVEALGYKYSLCNGGSTAQQETSCFTDAINAKPSVIIAQAVGTNLAASGYAAAKAAGIPIVGIFTGNDPSKGAANTEVGGVDCVREGDLVGNATIANSNGNAHVLYLVDTNDLCDAQRQAGVEKALATCSGCSFKLLQFDRATIETTLPQQVQAALDADPNINWIVGTFDQASEISVTQVQQSDKQRQIQVAGFDADPPNIQFIKAGEVQTVDASFGTGEAGWTAVDAAARLYSGLTVPDVIPVHILLIEKSNAAQLGSSETYNGAANYTAQFKALWGM